MNPTAQDCTQQTGTGLQAWRLVLSFSATHPLVASGKSLSSHPAASWPACRIPTALEVIRGSSRKRLRSTMDL